MFEVELKYFIKNQKNLIKKYSGKYLVIKDHKVLGVFESELDAYIETGKTETPGTFLIQHCIPGKEAYTLTFHSRVSI